MKTKILLPIAIIFFASTTANAQINEGRYLLGGSISYSHQNDAQNSNSKYNSFYSNVQFGKVIKDNTVAGIIVSYSNSNNNSFKSNQFSAGVFYRKYKPLAKNLYFFGEGDVLFTHAQNTSGHFQTGYDAQRYLSNGGTLSFIPGISYSICKRMQVELSMPNIASISYAGTKNETTSSVTNSISTVNGNNFSGNINLNSSLLTNFGIGFKFFLGK
ncbi:MAG TPA: hypothetical protein VFI29_06840 [Hanamia sp.]|nr:hypothetical protein [Hanamia sp.]